MNTGSNITLANGLVVSVDWISFTLSDSDEPASAFSLLGYSSNDFTSIDSGRFGYRARLMSVSGGLDILYDGNEGMGVHVDISGSGITDVLAHYLKKDWLFLLRSVPWPMSLILMIQLFFLIYCMK